MEDIVEEVKRRFPIGCRYMSTAGTIFTLLNCDDVYRSFRGHVHAHRGGGCLYEEGKYANRLYEKIDMEINYEIY